MFQLEAATSSLRRFAMLLATVAVACIGLGIGLTLTASGVLATHDGSVTIHDYVDRVSRVARIVEDPDSCTRYERLVEWQSGSGAADLEARVGALEQETAAQQEPVDASRLKVLGIEPVHVWPTEGHALNSLAVCPGRILISEGCPRTVER